MNGDVIATELAGGYRMQLELKPFVDAIQDIASFKPKKNAGRLKLTFHDDVLHLSMPQVDIGVPAAGSWPTEVSVEARVVWALASVPPSKSPLAITYKEGVVRIGTTLAKATSKKL